MSAYRSQATRLRNLLRDRETNRLSYHHAIIAVLRARVFTIMDEIICIITCFLRHAIIQRKTSRKTSIRFEACGKRPREIVGYRNEAIAGVFSRLSRKRFRPFAASFFTLYPSFPVPCALHNKLDKSTDIATDSLRRGENRLHGVNDSRRLVIRS